MLSLVCGSMKLIFFQDSIWLKPGDVVEIEVERVGVLRNHVVAEGSEAR